MNHPLPENEAERLDTLRAYAVLDTPSEEAFDEIANLAARLCGASSALVTFVDATRQWFKAGAVSGRRETTRDESICSRVVFSADFLEIPDAVADPAYSQLTVVREAPHLRFYAGAPLVAPNGHVLGTLCVYDPRPRAGLTADQRETLKVLAAQVMAQLELRRRVREQARTESALLGILEDQRLAEQALRRSEAEQRALAQNLEIQRARLAEAQAVAKIGAWETDLQGFAVHWSDETHRIFGTDPRVFAPTHAAFLDLVHPDDRARVDAAFKASLSAPDSLGLIEHRLLLPDGTIKHVEERWRIFIADDGALERAAGTCQDITERVHTEAQRTRLERRLAETLESISDAFLTLDSEWRVTYVNGEAERLLRRDRQSLLGSTVWADPVGLTGTRFERELRGAAENRTAVQFEEYVKPLDQWLETRAFPFDGGLAIYLRDVSERRRADAQMRLLQSSISRLNDIVIITKADHVTEPGPEIVFVNEAFERITGYTAAEVLGRSPRILQGPKTSRETLDRMRDAIKEGRPVHEEILNYTKDGREYWIDVNISPVTDAEGSVTHLVAIERDITERKKLEEQFLRAQRMESIGTLAGGIAHDLNNLLAPILMGIDLIRQLGLNDNTMMVLQNMERSAQRGANLVKQVLSFARGVEGARVSVHLKHIVHEIEAIVANTFPKSIVLEHRLARDLWLVSGDPTQLNQVLLNLCVNARDAMPTGGKLTITLRNVEIDEQYAVMNRGVAAGRYVLLEVGDTGQGMTKQVLDRIFEPFFTTKDVGAGSGLGLSTVLGIVRSHGGMVNAYSEPGRGSVFKVYLPSSEVEEPASLAVKKSSTLPRGNGELVLIVDDEASIRDVTRQTLEAFGYHAITADDGAQAIAIFAERRSEIRVIITDMMMPVMDGPALIAAVRRIDDSVPIIAASGLNSNGGVTRINASGVRHFLAKPYTTDALLQTLRTVFLEKLA